MHFRISITSSILATVCFCSCVEGQTQALAQTQPQITQAIDETNTVTLVGNVHPLIASASSSTAADLGMPMQHMVLSLKGSAAQEAALDQLLAEQRDPTSPLYHQYLTPQSFATLFGAAPSDINKVSAWLQSHGFQVEQVPAGNRALIFSGNAAQVTNAFKTPIRQYVVAGISHYANSSDPSIPAALAGTVGGVVKLHDFRHTSNISTKAITAASVTRTPQYTSGSSHYLTPADYYTIYDINPLLSAGITGSGQTIAVIARSDIYLSDVQAFRSTFGLKANDPQFIVTNSDPGVLSGDSVETTLDTEWTGAVAPNATVKVIISSSGTSDGVDLSSVYAVNNNVAPIITLSYGSCELGMGSSELSFYNSLWKQAATQGQSVMVSSGDSGAAGCDYGSTASYGQNVNGLCSSPYATCVGGTEFADTSNPGQYWHSANTSSYGSAISYIPESVWNESGTVSGGSGLWSGGGGASIFYAKPSWQAGPGVPADNKRDVPDVSLAAASHDGYFIAIYGGFSTVGGTSAAAPSFAGMVALIDQKMNARQGLLNSTLYPLAVKQAAGGAAIFHDITTGNNSVPGATGFTAAAGYDLASGLGTIDASLLINHWTDGSTSAGLLSLTSSSSSLTVISGASAQTTTITSTASASLKAAVALTVTAPAGITATLASATIASPGSGADVLSVSASSTAAAGTYPVIVTAVGGGVTATVNIAIVVPTPSFTVSSTATSLSVAPGTPGTVNISIVPQNGFSSTVALAISGLPTGVTAVFSPTGITPSTASALNFTALSSVVAGSSLVTITGTGGGVTAKTTVLLTVSAPALSLSASAASLSLAPGVAGSVTVTTTQSSLTSPVTLSVTGLPAGVTAAFSPATLSASGGSSLKLTAANTVTAGTYALTIIGTSGGLTAKCPVSLVIPAGTFTLAAAASSVSVTQGNTGQLTISTTPQNGFNSSIGLSVSGLPSGVTSAFAPATISGTATGSTLTLTVSATATAGNYPLVISAVGGGITKTAPVTFIVNALPTCIVASSPASLTFYAGLSASVQLSCGSPTGTFSGPLAISLSGAPSGMTAQLGAGALAAGSSVALNISTNIALAGGTYNLSFNVSGSGFTKALVIPINIQAQNTLTLTASQMSLILKPGASGQVTLTTAVIGRFNSGVAFTSTTTGGITLSLSNTSLAAPGSGTIVANITAPANTPSGNYVAQVTAIGGSVNESVYLGIQVSNGASFSFAVNTAAVTVTQGGTGTIITSTGNYSGGFNGQLSVSITGLPIGANYGVTGANASNNMVNITYGITTSSATPAGTYPVTITATGSGITHSATVQLTVVKR